MQSCVMEMFLNDQSLPSAGLLRRFVAIFYDSLLLFSALFFASALAYPVTHGQVSLLFQIYLLVIWFLYFAWPWIHSGQTLGMKAWRIQLLSADGHSVTWQQALLHFSMAFVSGFALGMGFLWTIVDKQKETWHEKVANTRLVYRAKVK
ncbi:MAG: RDD family protein [Candidatus Parabeggiatoa sp. nov. 3]|nr:MAG: RDD family protein [Gammaproteobacteria bacterium]RKZ58856.1 MAG: RDD family protein [Gammaproteobacteria bacterium]RKZ81557.1 MAG: RDD family protein [Gammaproteobacteria bacterium]